MEWTLMAEAGRAKGLGLARPVRPGLVTGEGVRVREEGCWRTLKT